MGPPLGWPRWLRPARARPASQREALPPLPPEESLTPAPSFTELVHRFDLLLLEGAAILGMGADDLASGAGDGPGYETLEEAFAAFGMDADAYAAEQSLLGLRLDQPDPVGSKASHAEG